MSREEDAYVIERMGKLLAEIAIVVNGPEPPLTRWSYHDLPEKVRALKEAQQPAPPPAGLAAVPEGGLRDSVLNSAKFRASCYALVGIVEGIQGLGRCWAANGERLKDTPEWVAFYNCVAAMRNGTAEPASAAQAPPAAAASDRISDERLRAIHREEQFGLFCDYEEFVSIARHLEALLTRQAPPSAAPKGMVERVEAALRRIHDGHCIRRIPADPTDPDLVLAEVLAFLRGEKAPFWAPEMKEAAALAERNEEQPR